MEMKITKSASKMRNLDYQNLEMQTYLKELDFSLASTVLKFRLRMALPSHVLYVETTLTLSL